jgi:hypothetical protein
MVQEQLVEYVSSQLKLGISRDAIKSALVGVGWAPLDIEDTLKKVEGGSAAVSAQPAVVQKSVPDVAPAGMSAGPKPASFSMPGTPVGQAKVSEQTIRVSDLVSSVPSSPITISSSTTAPKIVSKVNDSGKTEAKGAFFGGATAAMNVQPGGKKKFGLFSILAIVLIVILGAFAGYLFFQNNGLNSELQAKNGQNQSAAQGAAQSAQSSAAQVQALNASNTALAAQVTSLTTERQDLLANLLLLVAPAGLSSTTSVPISISGTLSAGLGKNTYAITTQYGVKAYIKNSSSSLVAAALQPLLGAPVQLSGTYIPGQPNITVTEINGSPVSPPPAPITTTTTPAATKAGTAMPPANGPASTSPATTTGS